MVDKLTFTAVAGDAAYDLFSPLASNFYMNNIAQKIARGVSDRFDDNELTKDEFVGAMTSSSADGKKAAVLDAAKASALFDYIAKNFGDTIGDTQVVNFWKLLSQGDVSGLSAEAAGKEFNDLGLTKSLRLYWKPIGNPKDIKNLAGTSVGNVKVSRFTTPFGGVDKMYPQNTEEENKPVHQIQCKMVIDAKAVGMNSQEFRKIIPIVDVYLQVIRAVKSSVRLPDAKAKEVGCEGNLFHSVFVMNEDTGLDGENTICFTNDGKGNMAFSSRIEKEGKVTNLNTIGNTGAVDTDLSGEWHISDINDQGQININYKTALYAPGVGSMGTGSNASMNELAEGQISTPTVDLLEDIFSRVGIIYVALKEAMLKAGQITAQNTDTDIDKVITKLKSFYNVHEMNVEQALAMIPAEVAKG